MPLWERALAWVIDVAQVLSVSRRINERILTSVVGSDVAARDQVGPSMMRAPRKGMLVHSSCRSLGEEGSIPSGLRMHGVLRMIILVKPLLGTRSKESSKGRSITWQ